MWLGLNFGSSVKGKSRVVRRLLGGIMTFRDDGLPVPLFGANNRQTPDGGELPAPEDAGLNLPYSKELTPINDSSSVDGRGGTETAGTSAFAPIPVGSSVERTARPASGQPEGISFTKGSRGDWIRTSDLLNPIQVVGSNPRRGKSRRFLQFQLKGRFHRYHGIRS